MALMLIPLFHPYDCLASYSGGLSQNGIFVRTNSVVDRPTFPNQVSLSDSFIWSNGTIPFEPTLPTGALCSPQNLPLCRGAIWHI